VEVRQEEAPSYQVESAGAERRRVLRDIHDGIGPILTGMAFGLRAARNLVRRDEESATRLLAQLEEELHGAIIELRQLTDEIRPSGLDHRGLEEAIRSHAAALSNHVSNAGAGELHIEIHALGDLCSLDQPVRVAAYRIVCEALTNMARHSRAHSCVVCIRLDEDLDVEVVDDGIGIPGDATPPWCGVGLRSMHDRAVELGGAWVIEPRTSGGTRVAARFPVHRN
jgi:signal transduction histidine kinase